MRAVSHSRFLIVTAILILFSLPALAGTINVRDLQRTNITKFLSPVTSTDINIEALTRASRNDDFSGRVHSLKLDDHNTGGWYTINIQNNTNETRFVFEFGHLPIERDGVLGSLGIINLSNKETIVNAMNQDNASITTPITIKLPKNEETSIAFYISNKPPYHFFSNLYLTPLSQTGSGLSPTNLAFIIALCASAFAVFSVGFAYHRFTGVSVALGALLPLLYVFLDPTPLLYWQDISASYGIGLWFMGAQILFFIATLFQARGGISALSGVAFLVGMLTIAAFFTAFIYGTENLSLDLKTTILRLAPAIPIFAALIVALQNNYMRSNIGRAAMAAILFAFIGHGLYVIVHLIPIVPSWFVYAPWIALLLQTLCFIRLLFARGEALFSERLRVESLKLKEAEQLSRIKQSKEAADQARLIRVIEREREVMEELRERESQRTEEMRRAKEAADEANRAKSAFLAVVSHEIRTPMTGIMGMVRLLLDSTLGGREREYAQTIKDSGDSMLRLLNDILDFSKIENDHLTLEDIEFDLRHAVKSIVRLMSGQASNKNIELLSDIDDAVPKYVRGDPSRLRQVLLNLVGNAIKFTSEGSVTIMIRKIAADDKELIEGDIPAFDEDRYIHTLSFAVKDTGIGISPEAQVNIFAPFSQADSSITRKFGGTGLGLAISKRLIEAMGGAISLKSIVNMGSTFSFTLRMAEGFSDQANSKASITLSSGKHHIPSLKVLVVEDNEINQRVIKEMLERADHAVSIANTGEKAMEIVGKTYFDLILMDDELPGKSGGETTQAIRKSNGLCASSVIIGLTGNVTTEDQKRLKEFGMNDVLGKPIDPAKLQIAFVNYFVSNDNYTPTPPPPPTKSATQSDAYVPAPPPQQKTMESSIPILDEAMFGSLRDTLGNDALKDLVGSLFEKADEIVTEIHDARDAKNLEKMGHKGHEMKGMAGNFGLASLAHAAGVLENAGKNKDESAAIYIIDQIESNLNDARDALKEYLS